MHYFLENVTPLFVIFILCNTFEHRLNILIHTYIIYIIYDLNYYKY
jgi:hypothetical protein